jgi:hypothetical protein
MGLLDQAFNAIMGGQQSDQELAAIAMAKKQAQDQAMQDLLKRNTNGQGQMSDIDKYMMEMGNRPVTGQGAQSNMDMRNAGNMPPPTTLSPDAYSNMTPPISGQGASSFKELLFNPSSAMQKGYVPEEVILREYMKKLGY